MDYFTSFGSFGSVDKENVYNQVNMRDYQSVQKVATKSSENCRLYEKVGRRLSGQRKRSKNSKRRSKKHHTEWTGGSKAGILKPVRLSNGVVKRKRTHSKKKCSDSTMKHVLADRNKMFAAKLVFYTLRNSLCKRAWANIQDCHVIEPYKRWEDTTFSHSFSKIKVNTSQNTKSSFTTRTGRHVQKSP